MQKDGSETYVTIFRVTDVDNKSVTVELFSKHAEDAYLKEMAKDKLFESNDKIQNVELIGSYKKVELKVVGE